MNAASRRAYEAVAERAGGRCEGCGERAASQMHHRQFRSRGGKDTPANLVHLCLWCHATAHSAEPPQGWAVHSWDDPAEELFLHHWGLIYLKD